MAVEHDDITDPKIHEPKGIAAASADQVYVADGAGSGTHKIIVPTNIVLIESASDFPSAVAGVRTLAAATTYLVSGSVSIGSDRLVMGAATLLKGTNPFADIIVSTTSGSLITSADTFLMDNLGFTCSSGSWLDLNGTGTQTFVATKCIVNSCDTIGTITDMITVIFDTCQITAATSGGLTFTGSNHGSFKITDGKYIVTLGPIVDFGTAIFDRIFIVNVVFDNPAGVTGLDIAASSANLSASGIGYITDNFFLTPANASVGYANGDIGWVVRGNLGIVDNVDHAQGSIENSALTTTVIVGTPVVANFGTAFVADEEIGFTISTAGRHTYDNKISSVFLVNCSIFATIAGGAVRQYSYFIAKNGTIIGSSISTTELDGTNPDSFHCQSVVSLDQTDFVELFVRADTTTTVLNLDTVSFTVTQLGV